MGLGRLADRFQVRDLQGMKLDLGPEQRFIRSTITST